MIVCIKYVLFPSIPWCRGYGYSLRLFAGACFALVICLLFFFFFNKNGCLCSIRSFFLLSCLSFFLSVFSPSTPVFAFLSIYLFHSQPSFFLFLSFIPSYFFFCFFAIYLSVCMSVLSSIHPSIHPSTHSPTHPPSRPSICLFVRPSVLSVYLSIYLFIYLSICLSVCLSVFSSFVLCETSPLPSCVSRFLLMRRGK